MSLQEIENFLSHKTGIDASIIGTRKITKAVETRRLICGVSNINNYWQILQSSIAQASARIPASTIAGPTP